LNYVAEAGFAEGGGGYRAYGYYRGFAGLVGDGAEDGAAFAFVPVEKIADGGGAEEEDGLDLTGKELALAFAFGLYGEGAIGDYFGDVRADATQSFGEILTG
jgi:hypothetical protein